MVLMREDETNSKETPVDFDKGLSSEDVSRQFFAGNILILSVVLYFR